MKTDSILLSSKVLNSLRNLPEKERITVTTALIADLVLGEKLASELPEFEYLIYSLIADSIHRDSYRYDKSVLNKRQAFSESSSQRNSFSSSKSFTA